MSYRAYTDKSRVLYNEVILVRLSVWIIDQYENEIKNNELQKLKWFSIAELRKLPVTKPNKAALKIF